MEVRDLGLIAYSEAWKLQQELVAKRKTGTAPDTLLLLEHPHVITLGRSAQHENILAVPPDVEIQETNRGGDVTYHGPGQLVGYPIFDLHGLRKDVAWYMRTVEECLIGALGTFGIHAGRIEGLTGVWVGNDKIAAMGVHLSRWITCHGFALNVSTDLKYFDAIIPCGIRDHGVTSMEKVLAAKVPMPAVKQAVIRSVQKGFFEA